MTDSTDNARGPERIWANPDHWIDHPPRRDSFRPHEYAEYVRVDLAPLGAVKVKPLVWHRADLSAWGEYANAGLLKYRMTWTYRDDPEVWFTMKCEHDGKVLYEGGDEDAAIAAANTDCAARISSALEPADVMADPRVVALVDLLREARSDLEHYVTHEYPKDQHPYYARQWHRDMELCRRIDEALARITDTGGRKDE